MGCYTVAMNEVANWITENQTTLISIAFIIIGAWIVERFGHIAARRIIKRTLKKSRFESESERSKRENTIDQILSGTLHILIWPIAIIMIVSQLGVDIAPLIAGAGIIGLAVGFGAQSLVKDIISGLFIIIENQYRVGDVVKLGQTAGSVERINLRVTVMRDLDGIVHTIPNGTIDITSNFTKEHSGINLNVRVDYSSDINKVIEVINNVGVDMAKEDYWSEKIIEAPQFSRVDNFAENGIEVKITGDVQPLTQWEITGELRKRLIIAFDKTNISFALPQRVIHNSK